ncbi:MAG TPA: glycosyltransferase family 39 protein [Polyangia bacterium]|nr:glycosyltransferase family 39 protein [Polyangia bacterium]
MVRNWRNWTPPLLLAALVTLANALKPLVIDDTAYVAFARQIAAHPFNPYGFTIFWDTAPEPAFGVLAPPVLPYWLALGIRLFGEHPFLLKLWLFPFLWALTAALSDLLRRFAGGSTRLLPLIVLSPAVLPTVNLMLDVPALALGLTALSLFARAADRDSWRLAAGAGLLAALAAQTKYTMFAIPPAIAWYGATHRRFRLAAVAVTVAVTGFVGWELLLVARYGHSHLFFQLAQQQRYAKPAERTLGGLVQLKARLISPLVSHLGCLGAGIGLVAAGALGVSRRWLLAAAAIWALGFVRIALVPHAWAAATPAHTLAVKLFWRSFGLLTLVALAICAGALVLRRRKPWSPEARFLVGWLLIELASYFVLTPFPAARRGIGLVVVAGLFAAHVVSRVGRLLPARRPAGWIIAFGIATGLAVTVVDTVDVSSEKVSVERATALTAARPAGSTVWCLAKWGFHYYCERAGMRPIVSGRSSLAPGDLLVIPLLWDANNGFGPPNMLESSIHPELSVAEQVAKSVWNEPLSGQTVTNFYGGTDPVMMRDHPRLAVGIYQIKEWRTAR